MNVFKTAVVAWTRGTQFARAEVAGAARMTGIACVALGCSAGAHGEVIAAWNMNGFVPGSSGAIAASTGLGSVDLTPFGDGVGTLLGTALGATKGDIAGESLSIVGNSYNGLALTFGLDASMHRDLSVSFAVRRSSTGFATNRIEWWSGSKWTTLSTFGASTTTWDLRSFDFSAVDAMDGQYGLFRFVLDGATGSSGSIRFDNVVFSGTVLPAPGAVALLGLAGIVVRRRR